MKIVIVGLLGSQAQIVEKACPEHEFRFFDGNAKTPKTDYADHVIGMRNFIHHHTSNAFKGNPKYALCRGGVSTLIAMLHDLK